MAPVQIVRTAAGANGTGHRGNHRRRRSRNCFASRRQRRQHRSLRRAAITDRSLERRQPTASSSCRSKNYRTKNCRPLQRRSDGSSGRVRADAHSVQDFTDGTGAPASERVPASRGPSVPTSDAARRRASPSRSSAEPERSRRHKSPDTSSQSRRAARADRTAAEDFAAAQAGPADVCRRSN